MLGFGQAKLFAYSYPRPLAIQP